MSRGDSTKTNWILVAALFFGLLAAVAFAIYSMDWYYQRTTRSLVMEGHTLASGATVAVAEYFESHGAFPDNNAQAGISTPESFQGQFVTGVEIQPGGRLEVAYDTSDIYGSIRGKQLKLMAIVSENRRDINWICFSEDIEPDAMPEACGGLNEAR